LGLVVLGRWAQHRWLLGQRRRGAYMRRALVVGSRGKSQHVASSILREGPATGLVLVGALTKKGDDTAPLAGSVPVVGDFSEVLLAAETTRADTLIFTGSDDFSPRELRELGWQLQDRSVDLIVVPSLTDVAGPRIHARPVAGLPLIHVEYPVFEGVKYYAKRTFDLVASGLGLILLSPVLLLIALVVRIESPGPILFRQKRVGVNGAAFSMFKFRSMVADAEARLPDLEHRSDGNGVLFKLKSDPRVTRVGRLLRRFSLDELPQLLNVFIGDMSLVGPRPPLQREVEQYDHWANRRLLVKPGITGLWQVSGRSDLSWDDSVRLDLYYVENWSLVGDILILARTVRAVMASRGAY
ncbi:MAG: sugar transferase, partial [Microbacterium sp.]|uniref:sugar transferase n=1 Tax=Microbacterium sp. TaxID=51671 RepID=UPI003BAEE1F5